MNSFLKSIALITPLVASAKAGSKANKAASMKKRGYGGGYDSSNYDDWWGVERRGWDGYSSYDW